VTAAKDLSAAARRRVLRTAHEHKTLGPVLDGRGRVLLVEPHLARGAAEEQAVVGVYDYERDRTLVAIIDSGGKVITVEELPVQLQLSDDERAEAESLASADPHVRAFLRRRRMNPLTRLYFPPTGPAHRYAVVFLRPSSSERAYAVVDLSEGRVTEVLDREEFAG
jgi:hypothetical protein